MTWDDERQMKVMKWYCESAATYTKLALAGLLLPVTFARDVLGVAAHQAVGEKLNLCIKASWAAFLLAAGFGLIYQYLAIGYWASRGTGSFIRKNPGYLYGLMLVTLFLAAGLFLLGALIAFRAHQ